MEAETALGSIVERAEERHALNVVPVEMRHEHMCLIGPLSEFTLERLAEDAEAGATVENVNAIAETHFDARSVAAVAHVLGLWSGRGATHSPEFDSHWKLQYCVGVLRHAATYS